MSFPLTVLRAPLLPLAAVSSGGGLEAPGALSAPGGALADALARDRLQRAAELRAVVADASVREALGVASPSLAVALDAWLADATSRRGHDVLTTLFRYVTRMRARATPFQMFGTHTVCTLGKSTRLELAPADAITRSTRLELDLVLQLAEALERDPTVGPRLRYHANTTLSRSGELVTGFAVGVDPRIESMAPLAVSFGVSPELLAVLERARPGATLDELVATCAAADPLDPMGPEDAGEWVRAAVAAQLLESEVRPRVVGDDPLRDIAATLRARAPDAAVTAAVDDVLAALEALDRAPLGRASGGLEALHARLDALPVQRLGSVPIDVQLRRPARSAVIGAAVVAETAAAIDLLHRVVPPDDDPVLRAFADGLRARWGTGAVSLFEAVDALRGLGFGLQPVQLASPLLATLTFAGSSDAPALWDARARHMLDQVLRCARAGTAVWELSDQDIAALAVASPPPLPDSLAAHVALSAESPEALADDRFQLVFRGVVGFTAGGRLSRYSCGDPEVRAGLAALAAAEQALHADAIVAEVAEIPPGPNKTTALRAPARAWEIPYTARAHAPIERQIQVSDLEVSASVGEPCRIVLRSRRLGREVVPRLTAPWLRGATPVVDLLARLQRQGRRGVLRWSWGPLATVRALPRVTRGRVILDLARWRLDRRDVAPLASPTLAAQYAALQRVRAELGLPRRVALVEDDNVLPLDLDDVVSIEVLADALRRLEAVTLVEEPPEIAAPCVTAPGGTWAHDLQLSFVATRVQPSDAGCSTMAATDAALEWLDVDVSLAASVADAVLCEDIAPGLIAARKAGALDCWSFGFVSEGPTPVLRVQLCGDAGALRARVAPDLAARAHDRDRAGVWSSRVVDRGAHDPRARRVAAERFWDRVACADSEAIAGALQACADPDLRWRLGLFSVHRLLLDLGLDAEARRAAARLARDAMLSRMCADATLRTGLSESYRRERADLEALVGSAPGDALPAAAHAALDQRRHVVAVLRAPDGVASPAVWTRVRETLARVRLEYPERHEAVIWDFLARLYESEAARLRLR